MICLICVLIGVFLMLLMSWSCFVLLENLSGVLGLLWFIVVVGMGCFKEEEEEEGLLVFEEVMFERVDWYLICCFLKLFNCFFRDIW